MVTACPLEFKQPTEVIKACRNVAAPSPSCCSSLNAYISGIQNQMLITNKQAIVCATVIGSMLRKGGVMTNIYELCDVDLKDFSVQGNCSVLDSKKPFRITVLSSSLPDIISFSGFPGISLAISSIWNATRFASIHLIFQVV